MNPFAQDINFLLQAGRSFLSEYKEGLFFAAVVLFALSGLFVGMSDVIKKLFVIGFLIFLIFPTTDINFFVDVKYLGVTRGLYVTMSDMFLLSLFIGTLVEASRHRLHWFPRGVLPYVLLLAVCAVTIINARFYQPPEFENPGYAYSLFELFNMIKGLLLVWVMVNFLRTEKEIKFLIYTFVFMLLIETGFVAYDHFIRHIYARAAGTVGHSNALSMFVGMFVPLMFVLAMTIRRKGVMSVLMVLALLGGFTMVIRAASRAGIVAMCITTAIAMFFILRNARQLSWIRIGLVFLVFLVGGSLMLARFWERLAGRFGQRATEAAVSTEGREQLLEAGIDKWLESPVMGHGLNTFPMEIAIDPKYFGRRAEEHNLYLLMLAETGVVGLAAMLFVFFRFFYIGWRKVYSQNVSFSLKIISIGVMCGLLHVVMQSYFEFLFRAIFVSYFFWTLCAILVASSYIIERKVAIARLLHQKALLLRLQRARKEGAFAEAGT